MNFKCKVCPLAPNISNNQYLGNTGDTYGILIFWTEKAKIHKIISFTQAGGSRYRFGIATILKLEIGQATATP